MIVLYIDYSYNKSEQWYKSNEIGSNLHDYEGTKYIMLHKNQVPKKWNIKGLISPYYHY